MEERLWNKMAKLSEEVFGTLDDPSQIPMTREACMKLQRLHPKAITYKMDREEPVCWVVVLPTTKKLADRFLENKLTERELLEMSSPQSVYDAMYLCAAFTVVDHRKRGYATQLLREAVEAIPHTEDVKLFAWAYTKEGEDLIERLKLEWGKEIQVRKDS